MVGGGGYRLDALIESGGMGSVYRATRNDGTACAVKLLHSGFNSERRHLARFQREALVTARLAHPHIVRVLDAGDAEGDAPAFLAMELLEGQSLSSWIKASGALSQADAVLVVRQVLAALEVTHQLGVVHRDLKPGNIFLTVDGASTVHAKVIDFGLAALMDSEAYERLTMTGQLLGTPAYMAPEQALGEPLDARTDLYAVGCVLYAALAGRSPYRGSWDVALPAMLSGDRPRLRELAPSVDPRLDAIVDRAMTHEARYRFASASAFEEALRAVEPRALVA
ncbi:MAG: serine/threonine protein kinase, partial [Deltaproteobacteria bacterium]